MENPTEKDPSLEDSDELNAQEFNKNEFSIEIDETKEGKQTFYVKSEEFFQKIAKSLKNFADYFKFKFKKIPYAFFDLFSNLSIRLTTHNVPIIV